MPQLVDGAAKKFRVREVVADSNYLSVRNVQAINNVRAKPFIHFKDHSTGLWGGAEPLWERMFAFFMYRRHEFMRHYNQQKSADSAFSMIKRNFGDHLRKKGRTAIKNESLCKVLCHNVCVVIKAHYELGIVAEFRPGENGRGPGRDYS